MKLYGYFRSSAAYRVRIALELKGLEVEHVPVNLVRNGGEQHADAYVALNPSHLVPTLVDEGSVLAQSLAIVEYLDETHPEPPLLPADPLGRASVRALAYTIACDVHPVNNLRVVKHLADRFGASDADKAEWMRHWMHLGLTAYEAMLADSPATGRFSHGDAPTLADVCLVPQLFNAERFAYDFSGLTRVSRVFEACMALPAFQKAHPAQQPDAN